MRTDLSPRDLAIDLLSRSTCKVQMAAVLSDKYGRIFSWGWNSGYVHAEEMAIKRANPKRLSGAKITVVGRRGKNGNSVYACPCAEKCYPLIASKNIRYVDFRANSGLYYTLSKDT